MEAKMKKFNYLKEENKEQIRPIVKTERIVVKNERFDDSKLIKAIQDNKTEVKTEKVEVTTREVDLSEVQESLKDIKKVFENTKDMSINNLPLGKGNKEGDPTQFITVRITDGDYWVRPTDKIAGGGGGGSASSIGRNVVTGQKLVASSNVAIALSTPTMIMNGIIVRALAGNSADVYIGNAGVTSSNGFVLSPGESTSVAMNNLASVFVTGTAQDGVCYISSQ